MFKVSRPEITVGSKGKKEVKGLFQPLVVLGPVAYPLLAAVCVVGTNKKLRIDKAGTYSLRLMIQLKLLLNKEAMFAAFVPLNTFVSQ
jgi:hypothetical protein